MDTTRLHASIQKAFANLEFSPMDMAKNWVQYTGTVDYVINDLIYAISGQIDHMVSEDFGRSGWDHDYVKLGRTWMDPIAGVFTFVPTDAPDVTLTFAMTAAEKACIDEMSQFVRDTVID